MQPANKLVDRPYLGLTANVLSNLLKHSILSISAIIHNKSRVQSTLNCRPPITSSLLAVTSKTCTVADQCEANYISWQFPNATSTFWLCIDSTQLNSTHCDSTEVDLQLLTILLKVKHSASFHYNITLTFADKCQ